MKNKFIGAILFLILAFLIIPAASAQSVSINGTWEKGNWGISFIEDTFVILLDGEILQYGTYTLEPSNWGVTVTSNKPRNLFMEFGFERSYQGLTYDISANELVLSDAGWRPIDQNGYGRHFNLGTYRRGREPSEAGNPLIGTWRADYVNNEGKACTVVFRFFPNGKGVRIGFPQKYKLYDASLLRITYELGTKPGTGKISYWKIDTSTPNWESVVFEVLPFVIDGNILLIEGDLDGFRKR